jgi:hypothetical protein
MGCQRLPGCRRLARRESSHLKGDCGEALLAAVGVDGLPGGLAGFSEALPESDRLNFLGRMRHGPTALTPEQIKTILPMVAKLDTNGHVTRDFLSKLPEADLVEFQSMLPAKVHAEVAMQAAERALDAGDLEIAKAMLSKTEGGKQTLPYVQLAVTLAQDEPDDAVAWINSLPDGAAKTDAITNIAANWAKADQAAAAAWVEKLPPGKARDEAVTEIALLQGLAGDTTAAFALAASVQSESARVEAFAHAARNAWFREAAGAEALLAAQGLTAAQTQKVIAKIQTGKTR